MEVKVIKSPSSSFSSALFENLEFGKVKTDHMAVCEYREGKWHQPEVCPLNNFSISPFACFIHYGQAIFEGMKAFKNKQGEIVLFRIEDNWKRFNQSAHRIAMPDIPLDIFKSLLINLVKIDQQFIPDAEKGALYIRPFMFATEDYLGIKPSKSYQFAIIVSPFANFYNKPLKVKVEKKYARACAGGVGYAKVAGNYASAIWPSQKALEEGYDQVIWTDSQSHSLLEEAGTMNIVLVVNNELVFIPEKDTILSGITQDTLKKLATKLGIGWSVKDISTDYLKSETQAGNLTEVFGCGTAVGITAISEFSLDGDIYKLSQKTKLAETLKNYLFELQSGRIVDEFGFTIKVPVG